MCIVNIHIQCPDAFSELLLDNLEDSELTIESIIGTALLEVFDAVQIEDVSVHHDTDSYES